MKEFKSKEEKTYQAKLDELENLPLVNQRAYLSLGIKHAIESFIDEHGEPPTRLKMTTLEYDLLSTLYSFEFIPIEMFRYDDESNVVKRHVFAGYMWGMDIELTDEELTIYAEIIRTEQVMSGLRGLSKKSIVGIPFLFTMKEKDIQKEEPELFYPGTNMTMETINGRLSDGREFTSFDSTIRIITKEEFLKSVNKLAPKKQIKEKE